MLSVKQKKKNNIPKKIFEDGDFLVINKPSSWITNSAATTKDQPVVQDWLAKNFKFETSSSKLYRSGIVHRLDKETSGLLLIAKTKEAFHNLQKQFKERRVAKKYRALVHGKVEMGEGEIKAPVGRLPWRRNRFGVLPGGREAATEYKVLENYETKEGKYSLLELFPKTGRTHQIRIHLKYLGHPIVGDTFYAGRKTARRDRVWCPRLFLHASEISFLHPKTGKRVSFESQLPADLGAVLTSLAK
ncbi:MAG: Pseudouridine synthase [Candidatus Woesebacteria bacterium GW2011_GWB1_44_11b]|uniref:Pseudouridine synthase n=1 Tax=Candidatus Woesebacteria bacterium GW2011_GWB1_44_11b TaxID=1618580 RepID=A0A0G1INH6_9BACT|nr:MAG: Pseudouridine synthase [Candidatus Woesebacteria bacterium GW2011_GWB1_44_11b]